MLVCSSTNTTFLTHKRSERATEENDAVALSPSKDETRRREPPQRQGRATPLHTSTRRRRAPVDATGMWRGTLLKRTARAHVIPKGEQYPEQAASHSKVTLDAKSSASKDHQPRTRSSTTSSIASHHTSRETRQQSGATKARSRRRVSSATRSVRPQKHERRVR